jgi:hypothetical protein
VTQAPPAATSLLDSAAAPPAASSQPGTEEEFNLDRPRRSVKVKIERSDTPPLSHNFPSTSTDFNLGPQHASLAASLTTPAEVIDLTQPTPSRQFNLDRPLHKARSSGLASPTPPPAINLDRPLRKAKSVQSYQGLAPAANPSFSPGLATHPSLKQESTREEWADEKLAFPRSKVGDAFYHIFGD